MNINLTPPTAVTVHLQKGDIKQAIHAAKEILIHQPENVYCLSFLANTAMNNNHVEDATLLFQKLLILQPNDLNTQRSLGIICHRQKKFIQAIKYFLANIQLNPDRRRIFLDFTLLALSLKNISISLSAKIIEWVFVNRPELKFAYQDNVSPLITETSLFANTIARDVKYQQQKECLQNLCHNLKPYNSDRIFDFLNIFHGFEAPVYGDTMQKPTYHVFPKLTAMPFHDNSSFKWVPHLEDNFLKIKAELINLYKQKISVKPYVAEKNTGNQGLNTLANSLNWSAIHLIQGGSYNDELLSICPFIKKTLDLLPIPVISGNAPEVFLSILKPHTKILPHYGLSNIKLTVHLAIDIPENCSIRVGEQTQHWQEGKVLVFDDSFEHEAWNNSDKNRLVFIIEIWHPDLTSIEKLAIQEVMALQNKAIINANACTANSLISDIQNIMNKI